MFGLPAVYTYTQQKFFAYYFYEVFPFITPVVYPVGMIAQTGKSINQNYIEIRIVHEPEHDYL